MIPKYLAFIFLLSLAPQMSHSQYIPMAQEGKYWIYLNYFISQDDFRPVSGHAITLEGDTVISDVTYKKVYKHLLKGYHTGPHLPSWQFTYPYQTESKSLISFIREDTLSKKVYNLPISPFGFCDTTEHLIFDFSLAIGDTINSCIYDFIGASSITEPPAGIVDSIGALEIFGKIRNTIFTTGFDNYGQDFAITRISIVEGVGLEWHGLFFDRLSPLVDFCEEETGFCQLLVANSPVERTKEINLFPNPATHLVQISAEEEELKSVRIYTIMGVFKIEFLNTNTIDLSNFVEGVYLVEITLSNDERFVKKIIKNN